MKNFYEGYVAYKPKIANDGIYVPINTTVICEEGIAPNYSCLISKEMFVEAYNKWIKGEENEAD